MVKLIASDIDGTLLLNGARQLPDELFAEVRRLQEKGIYFVPASGRQYAAMRMLFAPVADEVLYLCENGALLRGKGRRGELLGKIPMNREDALRIAHELQEFPDCEILMSGEDYGYYCPVRDEAFCRQMLSFASDKVRRLERIEDIPEEIIKVSAYCSADPRKREMQMREKWDGKVEIAFAGAGGWVDFTSANKGKGLKLLCERLGIDLRDVVAFGDNFNDEAMLDCAGTPYIMESAAEELKVRYPNRCRNVIEVLKTF